MNKIIIILVIFVMLFSGFTLLENSQTNNFYENNINTNNFISSNSPIYNLTIYIHNSPAGNGYYQQLFNFNSTSYFINNLNQNASNFYISYENGTLIYSWIQNWNFTTKNLTVWSKLQNGTKVIMIEIFNQNTNLLSANGHIGEAPQLSSVYGEYDNGKYVFNFYDNFAGKSLNTSIWSVPSGSNYTVDNGFIGEPSGGSTTAVYNPSIQETNSIIVEWGLNLSSTTYGTSVSSVSYFQLNRYSTKSNMYFLDEQGYASLVNSGNQFIAEPIGSSGVQTFAIWNNGTTVDWLYNNNILYSNTSAISITDYLALGWAYNDQTYNFPTIYYVRTLNYISSMPTFTIELNTYNVNIKSFDKQSNSIHNYFFYNNSVYSSLNNTFVFKNKTSFSEISLIPLNFSSYFTEYKNITISQSQFLNNNNSYYYNLSIYYFNSNLNAVNPYDFANYIYPISILVFLLLGGIILFGTIKYRRSN